MPHAAIQAYMVVAQVPDTDKSAQVMPLMYSL